VVYLAQYFLQLLLQYDFRAAAAAQGFDPYKKQVVDYGVPKDFLGNPHHDQLTCFYYRDLMVKQLTNDWNKGALFLSFLRFDQAPPACVKEHSRDEKVLDYPEWGGYFRGLVKGDLVFFDASDGEDGGMPFAVYDSKTQKKIFEDNAYYVWMWNKKLRPQERQDLVVSRLFEQNLCKDIYRINLDLFAVHIVDNLCRKLMLQLSQAD